MANNSIKAVNNTVEGKKGSSSLKVMLKTGKAILPEISKSTESDETGNFEITQIPSGSYHVEVYADGYMDYSSDPFVLKQSKLSYEVILIKKITREIVVTATRTPKLYAETPGSTLKHL
jgi:outer membrane receptor for ferrienterochelin and colicins